MGRGRGRGYGRAYWTYPPQFYTNPPAYPYPVAPSPQSPENELVTLQEYKKEIENEKASIEQEVNDIENQIKKLKTTLEQAKKQPIE